MYKTIIYQWRLTCWVLFLSCIGTQLPSFRRSNIRKKVKNGQKWSNALVTAAQFFSIPMSRTYIQKIIIQIILQNGGYTTSNLKKSKKLYYFSDTSLLGKIRKNLKNQQYIKSPKN